MVHVDRLVTRELELPADLFTLEVLGLLLRHTNEDNPVAYAPLLPNPIVPLSDVVSKPSAPAGPLR